MRSRHATKLLALELVGERRSSPMKISPVKRPLMHRLSSPRAMAKPASLSGPPYAAIQRACPVTPSSEATMMSWLPPLEATSTMPSSVG